MYAQKLFVHDCSQGQRAEGLHACVVDSLAVLVLTFELKGEIVGQVATLVVSSKQPQRLRVPNLQRPQVENTLNSSALAVIRQAGTYLNTEVSSIDVVTEEEVTSICGIAANLEQLHQVEILPMNVTTYSDGRIHLKQVRFRSQYLCTFTDNVQSLFFGQSSFTIEVLLEEGQIGLRRISRCPKLIICGGLHGRGLYIYTDVRCEDSGRRYCSPLQTRSCVLT